jgi:N-methylhydantoinase B
LSPKRAAADLLRLDVFHHLFAATAEEMGATLLRSSFSANIRERRDFSCALFDGAGRMIGQAAHLPIHLGSTPASVRAAIERVRMQRGDAVLLNDPYAGGTHLPDLTLVSPVFLPGRARPGFYCANRAHHADVGGGEPGSMAPAKDVHGEGLRIPPTRVVRGGAIEREVLELCLANMRVPREREGDFLAQWSANQIGEERLLAMAREHGGAELRARAAALMDWTERLTRALLAEMPDGSWSWEDELDERLGGGRRRAQIRVRIHKRGRSMTVDLCDTDALPGSSLHATRAVTISAVFYVLRTLLPPGTPTNDGVLRPVTVLTRPGTLAHATYPAAVAAGNVETSQRLVDALFGALARALPARIPAASAGTMSNLTFGGDGFTYYETIPGGAGASPLGPGASAVQTHMTNTRNTPIEAFETSFPARVARLAIRRGSGGRGARRGGDGLEKELVFQRAVDAAFVGERQARGPWGLAGAGPGRAGQVHLRARPRGRWVKLAGKWSLRLAPESSLRIRTPGGGGHGAVR